MINYQHLSLSTIPSPQSPVPSPQSLVSRPYASWVALPLNLSCAGLGF
ncbi:MAG: hypothetical protein ACKPEO_13205 [Sphaerospermopsis kisseleviana]